MQKKKTAFKNITLPGLCLVVLLCILLCVSGCGNSETSTTDNSDAQNKASASEDTGTDAIPKEGTIDLTKMKDSLMMAVIKQMTEEPDRYDGREIVMEGTYQQVSDGEDGDVFHYCILQDEDGSMNGLEFVLKDKKGYPEEVVQIRVSGTFEVYKEKGDTTKYCRIQNATLKKVD